MTQQIICGELRKVIKQHLKSTGYKSCYWNAPLYEYKVCHFISDPDCGYHDDEKLDVSLPGRDEFYRCKL